MTASSSCLRSPSSGRSRPGRSAASPRSGGRELGRAGQPRAADLAAGEHLRHQVRDGDDLPLQALRGVHGEHLDAVGRDLDLAGRQPVLGLLGGLQVVEQRGQRGDLGARGEVGDHVGERVEVRAADRARAGGGLGVEQEHPLGVGDEVGERRARPRRAASPAPGPAGRSARSRQASTPSAGPGSSRASTRPACSACSPGSAPSASSAGVSGPRRGGRAGTSSRARGHSAARSATPSRQRAPVSSRTAAGPASGSATSRSALTRSRTSGVSSSPPSPTTSTGRPRARRAAAMASMSTRRRTSTADVGAGSRRRSHCCGDRVGHPVDLGGDVGEQRHPHVAAARPGPGRSSPTLDTPGIARPAPPPAAAATSAACRRRAAGVGQSQPVRCPGPAAPRPPPPPRAGRRGGVGQAAPAAGCGSW